MLEFRKNRYGNWVATTGKWHFQINKSRAENDATPFYVRVTKGAKKAAETLDTGRHRRFETMDAAVEFCEDLAGGKTTLEEIRAQFDAENVEQERRAVKAATERAKAFRDKLDGLGITYTTLLDLMEQQMDMDGITHRILMGYERGEGWPNV